jgi:tRNA dimethylallyltransferase
MGDAKHTDTSGTAPKAAGNAGAGATAPETVGIAITGATATGKTALAIEVAQRLDGEIISMDSRQVYRGMDIGTAKPAPAERGGVPHHGFDCVSPAERYSAGRFAREARAWIAEIRERGRVPILAGGTGFFLRALTHPMFREPAIPAERRERLKRTLDDWDADEVGRWARTLDPAVAGRLAPADRQRQARLVEVALLTGRPLSWWQRHAPPAEPPVRLRVFVLEAPRDALIARIDARVAAMVQAGLKQEVAGLVAAGYGAADPGMDATGYAEMLPHLAGAYDLDEAIARIRAATRRYARRQRTWLKRQLPPAAVHLDGLQPVAVLADRIVHDWREGTT